jgi:desulfoferrodoxin-like iron-binding protein
MANETSKRYVCTTCGSEMLVTRGGEGTLACCGQPMVLRGSPAASQQPTSPPEEARRG